MPLEGALAGLHTLVILALVARPVQPRLHPPPVLLVVEPVSAVLRPVEVPIAALSTRLVIFPPTRVNVPIGVDQPAHSIGSASRELPLKQRAIHPNLPTVPVSISRIVVAERPPSSSCNHRPPLFNPLAFVYYAVLEPEGRFLDEGDAMFRAI